MKIKIKEEIPPPLLPPSQSSAVSENSEVPGFHFLSHEYFEKTNHDSINEIIDNLPKARSDLLEYLVKNDGTVVCKWCGEVLPSRTHWYRHKYKLHVPTAGLPAGLINSKGYVGHCVSRHGSVEEAEKEEKKDDEESSSSQMIIKEEKLVLVEEEEDEEEVVEEEDEEDEEEVETMDVKVVTERIEKEETEYRKRSYKFIESCGRTNRQKKNMTKDEKKEDYLKQREKEEKLVADIIAKVKKECEDKSITMCRRGYSRRSTVMTSFREYDKRK
ncbi:conserved hypothetical protein [Pediculus humanus corporis]|uniref:C2H2-type domain-containing protein n=1 Tax=Pediculus humanus subsp. corporis TaxID=121224 RepID=E0VWQ0_PEDHC|nr:uncharacterized protein Phum_PHUM490050 [Pediculus humanus corporis]EEB17806.1 conserved hypothetical protein [Pediculus humanus corporis]